MITINEYKDLIGAELEPSPWLQITQERIDLFADATNDFQFIHVDPERAKETPFGSTIAHGYLTLSLLSDLLGHCWPKLEGLVMGINYGFEKVRFINPVLAGARIRAQSKISLVELKEPTAVNITRTITVEIEGQNKPALVAEWITRSVFA